MCCWQPLSSSCFAASFSSGSESDPPVAFIHQGLLCPGMSPTLSFSHNPRWRRDVGCRGNLGQIPRESTTPNNTQPPSSFFFFFFQNPTKLLPYHSQQSSHPKPSDMDKDTHTHTPVLSREKWKAAVVIYCSIKASCGRPMRWPVPLFASGPRDKSEFSALKQVLTQNSAVFPGENWMIFPGTCVCVFFFMVLG